MAQELGQQVIVDDRPGGALTVGLDLVAKSAPDGYTLGMGPIGALAITRHMVAKLPYDIERDFQPIGLVTRGHLLLAVSPKLPVKSVTELIAYAKENPGKLSNASSSNGSPGHVGGELFKFMTGTEIVHVPYRGGALAITRPDRRTRRHHVREPAIDRAVAHAGTVHALGVTARIVRRPFPICRPCRSRARLCGGDLDRDHRAGRRAASDRRQAQCRDQQGDGLAGLQGEFAKIGDEPGGGTPEDFAATIKMDSAKWGEVIKRAGIKIE